MPQLLWRLSHIAQSNSVHTCPKFIGSIYQDGRDFHQNVNCFRFSIQQNCQDFFSCQWLISLCIFYITTLDYYSHIIPRNVYELCYLIYITYCWQKRDPCIFLQCFQWQAGSMFAVVKKSLLTARVFAPVHWGCGALEKRFCAFFSITCGWIVRNVTHLILIQTIHLNTGVNRTIKYCF